MFNKILVLTAEGENSEMAFRLSDYQSLAQDVFKNLNPATDVYFSQGPMDVLDHSCSKLGFGGKMCIDGTFKYPEETDENYKIQCPDFSFTTSSSLKQLFKEIKHINFSLLEKGIPVLIISIKKNRKNHVKELHESIMQMENVEGIKMMLFVEHTVDANDLTVALWRFCNNLDPRRDHFIIKQISSSDPSKYNACIGFDGTIKTKEFDDFYRDWPNIIVADEATISSVDEKWNKLGLGDFIPSPSLKFKDQMYGEEAVANT
ncbi:MAG: UbiD family decarboxylase, partial [Bacteroidota bacterium]|nr:UbiD family decarboxylase [Bacteroidota bacterium]